MNPDEGFDTITVLAVREAQDALSRLPAGTPLVECLEAAMRVARDHWMCTREPEQFRAAVAAVMLHHGRGSPEYDRLGREYRLLGRFDAMVNAAQHGVAVDIESVLGRSEEDAVREPVGLMKLWHKVKAEHRPAGGH